jgi:futalosine hydrolase
MQILLVAATKFEIDSTLLKYINKLNKSVHNKGQHKVMVLTTGVGIAATIITLQKYLLLNTKPDLVINMGIAGSYSKKLKLGSVVNICSDSFADFGVFEKNKITSMAELGFTKTKHLIFKAQKTDLQFKNSVVKKIIPVTNNTVTSIFTSKGATKILQNKYAADTENMESAAVAYCANLYNVNYLCIRSISNYCGERDKLKWQIQLAINNLNKELINIIISYTNAK